MPSVRPIYSSPDRDVHDLPTFVRSVREEFGRVYGLLNSGEFGSGSGGGLTTESDPQFHEWLGENDFNDGYTPGTTVDATKITNWDNALILNRAALFSYDADGGADSLFWYRGPGGFYTTGGTDRHLAPRIAWTHRREQTVNGPYLLDGSFTFTSGTGTDYVSHPGMAHWIEIILYDVFGTLDNTIYTDYQELRTNPTTTTVKSLKQRIADLEAGSTGGASVPLDTFTTAIERIDGEVDVLESWVGAPVYSQYSGTARSRLDALDTRVGVRPSGVDADLWGLMGTRISGVADTVGIWQYVDSLHIGSRPSGITTTNLWDYAAFFGTSVGNRPSGLTAADNLWDYMGARPTGVTGPVWDFANANRTRIDTIDGQIGFSERPEGVTASLWRYLNTTRERTQFAYNAIRAIAGDDADSYSGITIQNLDTKVGAYPTGITTPLWDWVHTNIGTAPTGTASIGPNLWAVLDSYVNWINNFINDALDDVFGDNNWGADDSYTHDNTIVERLDSIEDDELGDRGLGVPDDVTVWQNIGQYEYTTTDEGEVIPVGPYSAGIWPVLTSVWHFQSNNVVPWIRDLQNAMDNVFKTADDWTYANTDSLEKRIDDLETGSGTNSGGLTAMDWDSPVNASLRPAINATQDIGIDGAIFQNMRAVNAYYTNFRENVENTGFRFHGNILPGGVTSEVGRTVGTATDPFESAFFNNEYVGIIRPTAANSNKVYIRGSLVPGDPTSPIANSTLGLPDRRYLNVYGTNGNFTNLTVANPPDNLIGPEGPQGETGPQGEAGPRGLTGATGPTGPQGDRGLQGQPGPQGIQGVAGARGPQGEQGERGLRGERGEVGAQGIQGPRGLQGDTGPAGQDGDDGAAGPVGPEGPQGPPGTPGQDGATGPAGPTGPIGPEGPRGDRGPAGATGPAGPQGEPGQNAEPGQAYSIPSGMEIVELAEIDFQVTGVTRTDAQSSTYTTSLPAEDSYYIMRGVREYAMANIHPEYDSGADLRAALEAGTFDALVLRVESAPLSWDAAGNLTWGAPVNYYASNFAPVRFGSEAFQGDRIGFTVTAPVFNEESSPTIYDNLNLYVDTDETGTAIEAGAATTQGIVHINYRPGTPGLVVGISSIVLYGVSFPQTSTEDLDGLVGPAGPAGPAGPTGPAGQDGAPGAVGPRGDTGPTGPTGPAGQDGAPGAVGATGPAGPAGPEGPQGERGPAGASSFTITELAEIDFATTGLTDNTYGTTGSRITRTGTHFYYNIANQVEYAMANIHPGYTTGALLRSALDAGTFDGLVLRLEIAELTIDVHGNISFGPVENYYTSSLVVIKFGTAFAGDRIAFQLVGPIDDEDDVSFQTHNFFLDTDEPGTSLEASRSIPSGSGLGYSVGQFEPLVAPGMISRIALYGVNF